MTNIYQPQATTSIGTKHSNSITRLTACICSSFTGYKFVPFEVFDMHQIHYLSNYFRTQTLAKKVKQNVINCK